MGRPGITRADSNRAAVSSQQVAGVGINDAIFGPASGAHARAAPRDRQDALGRLCLTCGGELGQCNGHPGSLRLPFACYRSRKSQATRALLHALQCLEHETGNLVVPPPPPGLPPRTWQSALAACAAAAVKVKADDNRAIAAGHARLRIAPSSSSSSSSSSSRPRPRPGGGGAQSPAAAIEIAEDGEEEWRPFPAFRAMQVLLRAFRTGSLALVMGYADAVAAADASQLCCRLLHPSHVAIAPPPVRPEQARNRVGDDEGEGEGEGGGEGGSEGGGPRGFKDPALVAIERLVHECGDLRARLARPESREPRDADAARLQRCVDAYEAAIADRLRGEPNRKDGRFRGTMMGKRVEGSARTVLTGGPWLDLDEIGVPQVAKCSPS